jgi:hypothetical protein
MCQGSNTSDTSSAQRSNSNKIWSDCVVYCQVGDSVSLGRKTYLQNSLPSRDHLNDPWPHLLCITQQQPWAKSHEKPNLLLVFFKQWLQVQAQHHVCRPGGTMGTSRVCSKFNTYCTSLLSDTNMNLIW